MRVEGGHWSWRRGIPLRYLLVAEDRDGEEHPWGGCADVERLFVDPVPLPRETLTFLGCSPDGPLRDALQQPAGAVTRLGDMCVEISNGERPVEWWDLADVVVSGHRPSGGDGSLVDVVVEAAVTDPDGDSGSGSDRAELGASSRYGLFASGDLSLGSCTGVEGLRVDRPEPAGTPMELIGCEPTELLREAGRDPQQVQWLKLWALDRHGRPMENRTLVLDPLDPLGLMSSRPSALGKDLLDITLAHGAEAPPSPSVRLAWDAWYKGAPSEPNLWARYDAEGRRAWSRLAYHNTAAPDLDEVGGTYHLDGRFVTDPEGLHCALAEALRGPGAYFGSDWQSFKDCLAGGFGAAAPFTLHWHDAEAARDSLGDDVTYLGEIVRYLEARGVTVILR
ncbi:barstar family protein [Streptomyces sp. NPDC059009]|uniref:barstar family protein n=1 Tax=Streptomyces sp. NPDC059009 TaxID=3346694 RepID=UPI0036C54C0F